LPLSSVEVWVLRGESPQNIPFEEVAIKKVVLNHDVAQKLGLKFPEELLKEEQGAQKKG